ncbi:MAG TPA: sensor histidine kinase [Puia sp.]|nr:sensor histidine kinase [Puia sp.]
MELPSPRGITATRNNTTIVHVLFWTGIILIAITQHQYYGFDNKPVVVTILHDLIILLPQIIASYFLAYFIVPIFLRKKRYMLLTLYFIAGSYLICALSRYLTVKVAEPLIGIPAKDEESILVILADVRKLIFIYFFSNFSVAFVFLFVKMLMDQFELRERNLMLAKEKSIAELQNLKAQLNPHFLFNTLNNIYSLSVSQHPATSASIARMSEILDHIIYRSQEQEVPLSEEIKLLDNYIGLEKLRYDDRLEVNFTREIGADVMIAPLMLLSLVENAFKHGGSETMGDMIIEIHLKSLPESFEFRVSNPRSNKSPDTTGHTSGIGLKNLRRQLELLYPKRYSLETKESMFLFTAELTLQFRPDEANAGPKNKNQSNESTMSPGRR